MPPEWIDAKKGAPALMLFSVVDARSSVASVHFCTARTRDEMKECNSLNCMNFTVTSVFRVFTQD